MPLSRTALSSLTQSRQDLGELECVPVLEGECEHACLSLTCEADGTLEGTSHAFKAVLYQVAKQLGR